MSGINGHAGNGSTPPTSWVMRVTMNTTDAPDAEGAAQLAVHHLRIGAAFQLEVHDAQTKETVRYDIAAEEPTPPVEASQNRQLLGKVLGALQSKALGPTRPEVLPALNVLVQEVQAAVARKPPIIVVGG